ncbi:MAG: hypothetical protein KGN02_00105 [bacterium]|nr:hypothetical protein [bacterium]
MILAALTLSATLAAQQHFRSALDDLYAYAGPAAADEFQTAATSDPHFALAYWGKALAEGSDLNTPLDADRFAAAHAASVQAGALEAYASPQERALIEAVLARYAGSYDDRARDERAYRTAMETYVATYPDDDDGTMLLVESLLESDGMHWNADGTPQGAAVEILTLTQRVLGRAPEQLFANHLCIHEYDDAPDRTPAIACAQRLDAMTFRPPQEHLAHMPAHTWIELGDGAAAVASSERAWALGPVRYAEHDAYVGLSAAMLDGDLDARVRWSERIAALEGAPPNLDAPPYVRDAQRDEALGKTDAALDVLRKNAALQANAGELLPLYPADVRIGALLFRAGRYADARDTFTATLREHPRMPRALFGMAQTLRMLGESAAAEPYERAFARAWRGPALTMTDF